MDVGLRRRRDGARAAGRCSARPGTGWRGRPPECSGWRAVGRPAPPARWGWCSQDRARGASRCVRLDQADMAGPSAALQHFADQQGRADPRWRHARPGGRRRWPRGPPAATATVGTAGSTSPGGRCGLKATQPAVARMRAGLRPRAHAVGGAKARDGPDREMRGDRRSLMERTNPRVRQEVEGGWETSPTGSTGGPAFCCHAAPAPGPVRDMAARPLHPATTGPRRGPTVHNAQPDPGPAPAAAGWRVRAAPVPKGGSLGAPHEASGRPHPGDKGNNRAGTAQDRCPAARR